MLNDLPTPGTPVEFLHAEGWIPAQVLAVDETTRQVQIKPTGWLSTQWEPLSRLQKI